MNQIFALMLRALRVDAREKRWHLMRFALVGILLWQLMLQSWNWNSSAPGLAFFWYIVMTNAVFLTVGGPILFGTVISEEKEERTLQLLKIASVGPLSILSGKLFPMLLSMILVLSIQYPFTLLAVTMGGVSTPQISAAFVSLLAYLVFVSTLATLCSTVFRTSGGAISVASMFLLGFLLLPSIGWLFLLLARYLAMDQAAYPMVEKFLNDGWNWNVFVRLAQISTSGFDEGVMSPQATSNLIFGGAFFVASWLVFDRCNSRLDEAAPTPILARLASRSVKANVPVGPRKRCWSAALPWRDYVHLTGGNWAIALKILGYGALVFLFVFVQSGFFTTNRSFKISDVGSFLVVLMTFYVLPLELMLLVARTYRAEIKDKTLTTLMMLPLSTSQIAYGKLLGSLLTLLPALGYLGVGVLLNLEIVGEILEACASEPVVALIVTGMVLSHVLLFLHLVAYFSVLTNAWAGVLIAGLVQWFATIMTYMTVAFTVSMMFTSNFGDEVAYFLLFLAIMANFVLIALLHWSTGEQLQRKAAES